MKKLLSIFIVLVLLFSACGGANQAEKESQEPIKTRETVKIDIPKADNSITLLLTNSLVKKNDVLMGAYMSELMKEAGFELEVKFYKIDYQNKQESIEESLELMRDEIKTGKNLIIESRYSVFDLIDENLLYYPSEDSTDPFIIIGKRKNYTYTGVYIDKSIEEKYGKSIENTYDYGEFLKWVSENNTDKIPGLFVMNGAYGESFNPPIALFAQENGYVRADNAVGRITEGGTTLYVDLEAIQTADEFTPIVKQAVNLPFFIDMDSALSEWSSNGYIKLEMFEEPIKFENYASLVFNVSDTTEYYSYDNHSSRMQLKDVSDFNLHIFTKDGTFPDTPKVTDLGHSGRFVISGESSSPETAAGFLEWIYSSTDNYLLFMCGKEGIDHRINEGELEFLVNSKNIKYGEWYKHTSFVAPEMNVVMPHFPANWKDVKAKLSDVEGTNIVWAVGYDNIKVDISKIVKETVGDDTLRSAYNNDVLPKYIKYFDAFKKEIRDYTADDLRNEIDLSPVAAQKEKAYEDLLDAICGN